MKSDHQLRIEEKVGHTIRSKPEIPSESERRLAAVLVLEEARELIHGLGFEITQVGEANKDLKITDTPIREPSLTAIADGCGDLSVVTIRILSVIGIPDTTLLELVDQNNLDKFRPGSYQRSESSRPITNRQLSLNLFLTSRIPDV